MTGNLIDKFDNPTIPIYSLTPEGLSGWLDDQTTESKAWIGNTGFAAKAGTTALVPGADGALAKVLLGIPEEPQHWDYSGLPKALPAGAYRMEGLPDAATESDAALGWGLACYVYERYKKSDAPEAELVWPGGADRDLVQSTVEATYLVRDLINTPAADLGPPELAEAAKAEAALYGADIHIIEGDALLKENYPAIHAVGRAAEKAPRLIDLRWGDANAPKVSLVGKGVCFDTGGLDLKTAQGMRLMKKDMGGAAHVLGVAKMIMAANLPVRLRMLIPAVENNVAGNAYRPSDVITSRKGLTIEIGNTDAEGRVILCDALAEADTENPEMLIDFATLTGAARVALGPELPALFVNDDKLAEDILAAGRQSQDPLWRMPLWANYRRLIESKIADLNNAPEVPQGGAITAALFLQAFVSDTTPWAHIDLMAWNSSAKPGRPEGGEAQAMRAVYAAITNRFSK